MSFQGQGHFKVKVISMSRLSQGQRSRSFQGQGHFKVNCQHHLKVKQQGDFKIKGEGQFKVKVKVKGQMLNVPTPLPHSRELHLKMQNVTFAFWDSFN